MKRARPLSLGLGNLSQADFEAPTERAPRATRVSRVDRSLCRALLRAAGSPAVAVRLWNGEAISVAEHAPVGTVVLRDRGALYRLIRNPDMHFGDLYSLGRIDVEGDFVALLEAVYRGMGSLHGSALVRLRERLTNRPRLNTLAGSRENIHHHYDLGNEFYRLWLDTAAMQYTCAYYPDPAMSLEQAQVAKLDHVARKLRLKPGDRVVEAGCGWGGLALHFARNYGVTVRAYNISSEQVAHARERARGEGLADRVEYVLDDYRNVEGTYDVFVSVGMLEHVGRANYGTLGEVIDRCLAPHGRGFIHSIGRNRPGKMNAWIEKRIFPGAYPPSLAEMMGIFEPRGFSVLDVENLRLHYARTLRHWLERFERNAGTVEDMFDPYFVRAWRLYLAGSIAAFTTGALQLFQVVFARSTDNDLAWSRAHLYAPR
ncbi:MAG: class I SAM-dependent methyltransferase [Burkholderiales bacterium]|nr:class I SAM-dependent methyltransferase [Burkholderiales bacterium]